MVAIAAAVGCSRQDSGQGGSGTDTNGSSGSAASEYHRGPQGAQGGGGSQDIRVGTGTEGSPTEAVHKNVVTNGDTPLGGAKGVGTTGGNPAPDGTSTGPTPNR